MINEKDPTLPPVREAMVSWYDPRQLMRTGLEVLLSTSISRHSDSRRIDALTYEAAPIDFSAGVYASDDGYTIDYVADMGDGWNSTYSVAWLMSQPVWKGDGLELPRGDLTVFGGDQVYPYPTGDEYERRLNRPYEVAAHRWGGEFGELLVLPGNHDWYDSLMQFRKLFCSKLRVGERQTHQRHSYFVAKLPHGWWLFAADTQLDADLDEAQADYLVSQALKISRDERAILCLADPGWFESWRSNERRAGPNPAARSIPEPDGDRLQQLIVALGDSLQVTVASDEHCYRRDVSTDGKHLIASGTGGAFLHPTHTLPDDPRNEFSHQVSYPTPEKSRELAIGNLGFLAKNPSFGALPAFAYLSASWANGLTLGSCYQHTCVAELGELGISRWPDALIASFHGLLLNPVGAVLYALIFAGFIFFTDRPRNGLTLTLGTVHAFMHILAGLMIYWGSTYLAVSVFELAPKSVEQLLVSGMVIFALAWLVGSTLFGLYLYLSVNVFGIHANESFSALRNPDYKGFLRFRIQPGGQLDMWFIGIDRAAKNWRVTKSGDGRFDVDPEEPDALRGRVVDHFTVAGNK